jgi:hypothetical protein
MSRTLFFYDGLHGAGGFFGIDVTELATINHQHLVDPLFGFVNLLNELAFQLTDILMQPGCRKK